MRVDRRALFAPSERATGGGGQDDARRQLLGVLEAAKRLLARPGNDFAWSGWANAEEARRDLDTLILRLSDGDWQPQSDVSILFAPTGPIQEVSINSGWGDEFLALAKRFDSVKHRVWPA